MLKTAVFGGGCFWQVEEAYRTNPGIKSTCAGYMGGDFENPLHLDVCARITGHAEVVQLTFNPAIITYTELLEIFWQIHDPTTLNRQGPDRGEQYRSVIFFHSPEQQAEAISSKLKAQKSFEDPIVTEIKPAKPFWPAKEEHQQYLYKQQSQISRSRFS